jgi:hypothetical protein
VKTMFIDATPYLYCLAALVIVSALDRNISSLASR